MAERTTEAEDDLPMALVSAGRPALCTRGRLSVVCCPAPARAAAPPSLPTMTALPACLPASCLDGCQHCCTLPHPLCACCPCRTATPLQSPSAATLPPHQRWGGATTVHPTTRCISARLPPPLPAAASCRCSCRWQSFDQGGPCSCQPALCAGSQASAHVCLATACIACLPACLCPACVQEMERGGKGDGPPSSLWGGSGVVSAQQQQQQQPGGLQRHSAHSIPVIQEQPPGEGEGGGGLQRAWSVAY